MLARDQFAVLDLIRRRPRVTQRQAAAALGMSLGKANQQFAALESAGLVSRPEKTLTPQGYEALEPYKVRNAVIMAAGMSSRFAPLSYEKPKALLLVKGELLIEREIRQLQAAGITDITVVVGYLKEKLFYLEDKYKVRIVVNDDYYRYNNPSTLMAVRQDLDNTYICSSDNYFPENPFEPYVYHAYYAAVYQEGPTDEYCLSADRRGRIIGVTRGGHDSWYMLGHVYFDRAFSRKFVRILEKEYPNELTKQQLWEDLYMRYLKELDLEIRKYGPGQIKEFDSLDELRQFDDRYLDNSDSQIFSNICRILGCEEKDIHGIRPIKTGLTNLSFSFECRGSGYVYRHPGVGTGAYIDRRGEAQAMEAAKELGLDDTFIYIDPDQGWKISRFINDARTLDYHNDSDVRQALGMLRKLHASGKKTQHRFDIWKQIAGFSEALKGQARDDFADAPELRQRLGELKELIAADRAEECLCHCDSYDPNFLIGPDGKMYLIDWEYAGMADPAGDIGTFLTCSDYSLAEAEQLIGLYLGHPAAAEEQRHYLAYAAVLSYYWFIWALYQESVGKNVGEWLYLWYKHTKMYGRRARELYHGEG